MHVRVVLEKIKFGNVKLPTAYLVPMAEKIMLTKFNPNRKTFTPLSTTLQLHP